MTGSAYAHDDYRDCEGASELERGSVNLAMLSILCTYVYLFVMIMKVSQPA